MLMKKWRVHAIIKCLECDFEEENYKLATKRASEHHRKTGHAIRGEIGYAVEWVAE